MADEKTILLHVCCAPCATSPIERLQALGYRVIMFFSNSNISPESEHAVRLEAARRLSAILDLELIEDSYDHAAWRSSVRGLELEPERGKRCLKCFEFSLTRTAQAARKLGIPEFSTTLTVSRHKSSREIFTIGESLEGFVPMDFKKQNGFTRSIELSRLHALYRQSYCGCEFSLR